MQKLHLVGFTTDHKGLIFSARRGAKSGGYTVALDDRLLEAVEQARHREDGDPEQGNGSDLEQALGQRRQRPESALSVREMQARLRSGRTVEQVAREAKVDVSWVERFAVPIRTEQAEIVRALRLARLAKRGAGESALPLGEAVYRNLVLRGVTTPRDELDGNWSARQLPDGRWLVGLQYTSRGQRREVAWEFDPEGGTVRARDRIGTMLGYAEGPARKRAATTSRRPPTGEEPVPNSVPRPSPAARAAAKRVATARKEAQAKMAAEAARATRRDASIAKKAASRKRPVKKTGRAGKAAGSAANAKRGSGRTKPATRTAGGSEPTPSRREVDVEELADELDLRWGGPGGPISRAPTARPSPPSPTPARQQASPPAPRPPQGPPGPRPGPPPPSPQGQPPPQPRPQAPPERQPVPATRLPAPQPAAVRPVPGPAGQSRVRRIPLDVDELPGGPTFRPDMTRRAGNATPANPRGGAPPDPSPSLVPPPKGRRRRRQLRAR